MPYQNYNSRIEDLYDQYKRKPELFTSQQIDELEHLANQAGIPFSRNPEEFSLIDIGKQAVSGFVTGLTTLPMGEEPKTVYEKISHSLGHLAGFAPSIIGGPATMLSRGLGKIGLTKASKAVAKTAQATIPVLDRIALPMIGSRYSKTLVDKALQKSGLDAYDFLKHGSKARAILQESVGLGTASTISNVWAGPDEYMNTFVGGAIAGGAFGGIGNFVRLGNIFKNGNAKQVQQAEQALKASIGAGIMGVPAYMRDEPIESIIYETLLGGYFGYKTRPAHEAEGGQFFRSMQYGNEPEIQFRPEKHPRWDTFSKKAQDYVNNESSFWSKKYLDRLMGQEAAFERAQERAFFNVNKPLSDFKNNKGEYTKEGLDHINKAYQELAYKVYKTMKKPSDSDYTAYPSAVDENDRVATQSQEDINHDVIMTPRIINLYNTLLGVMKKNPDLKIDVKTIDLANIINSSFKKTKDLNDPQAFLSELRTSILGKGVDKISNDLIKWYHQTGMDVRDAMIVDIDPSGKVISYPYQGSVGGKNIGIKSRGMPIDKQGTNRYVITNIKKYDSKGNFTLHKPFDYVKNKDGDFVPVLGQKEMMNLLKDLWTSPTMKMNIDSGIKDKGTIHVADFHNSTFKDGQLRYSLREIGERIGFEKETVKIEGKDVEYTFDNLMEFSRQEMYNLYGAKTKEQKQMLKEIHDASYVSNVLKEAQKFGLLNEEGLLGDRVSDLKSKDFYKNAIDYNKRRQGDFDRGVPMGRNGFITSVPEGALRFSIVKDIDPKILNTKLESGTDGTMIVRQDVFDDASRFMGSDVKKIGFHKPVIKTVINTPEGPTEIYIKSAGQRATDAMNKFMIEKGLHALMYESTNKVKGRTKPIEIEYDSVNNKYTTKNDITKEQYEVPLEDFRINLTTAEQVKLKDVPAPIQLSEVLNNIQSGKAARRFVEEIIDPSINGDPKVNKIFDNLANEKEIIKAINSSKDFVDKIDIKIIHRMFVEHPDSNITKALANKIGKLEREQLSDNLYAVEDLESITQRNKVILRESDAAWFARHLHPYSSKHWEPVYDRYMMRRIRNPKIKNSAKAIFRGIEEDAWHTGDVIDRGRPLAENEIILGSTLRGMSTNNKEYPTLGKLFDAYKQGKVSAESLEIVAIRTPADSISAVRVLKLRGFSKEQGTGAHTHPLADGYMGGADKDIDSMVLFQGFSKPLKDAYRKHANEWQDSKGNYLDGKPKRDDDLFMVGRKLKGKELETQLKRAAAYKTSASKFSPSMRLRVGINAKKGIDSLGFGLVAKKKLYDIYNLEHELQNVGKRVVRKFEFKDKYDNIKIGTLEYTVGKKSGARLRDLGRQIVNRSADASDTPMFVERTLIPEILVKEAFPDAKVTKYGETKPATIADFYQAYPNVTKSISGINPRSKNYDEGGRNLHFYERQAVFSKVDPRYATESLWSQINKRIRDKGLDADYRRGRLDTLLEMFSSESQSNIIKMALSDAKVSNTTNKQINKMFPVFFELSPKTVREAIEAGKVKKAEELMFHDVNQIVGRNSIVKAYESILNTMKAEDVGVMFENPNNATAKAFRDVVKLALNSKKRIYNMQKHDSPKDASKSTSEIMDREIQDNKTKIAEAILPLKDLNPQPFMKLYETILLSPYKQTTLVATGAGDPLAPKIQADTWNSIQISEGAKRNYLKETDKVFTKLLGGGKISDQTIKDVVYKAERNFIEKTPVEAVETKVDDFMTKLKYKAVTEEQVKEYNDLKEILKSYPEIANDLESQFNSWQDAFKSVVKDVGIVTAEDIAGFNRFLRRKDPEELSYWAYYKDPSQVSREQMKHDQIYFDKLNQPVKTSDGLVRKTIKKMTSTMGSIKDWFHKADGESQYHLGKAEKDNLKMFDFRRNPNVSFNDKLDINRLVVLNKESRRQTDFKSTLEPEIKRLEESLSKKYKNLDQMVEKIDAQYTKDVKAFGEKWIYGKKGSMEAFEKAFMKNGVFNTEKYIKLIDNPYSGKEFRIIPLNLQARAQYEMVLNKLASRAKDPMAYRAWHKKKYPFKGIGTRNAENYWHKSYSMTKSQEKEVAKFIEQEMRKKYQEVIDKGGTKDEANTAANLTKESYNIMVERSKRDTGGAEFDYLDSIVSGFDYHTLNPKDIARSLENIGFFSKPNPVLQRTLDLPTGFDTRPEVYDSYKKQIINSHYKNLGVTVSDHRIEDFMKRAPMDKDMNNKPIKLSKKRLKELKEASTDKFTYRNNSDVYADYLRLYLRDVIGYQSTFPERMIHAMNTSDPLKLKKNLYYGLSDQVAIKYLDKLNKVWVKKYGKNLPFLKDLPEGTSDAVLKERAKIFSRLLKNMSRGEARYELLTLLANTGTMTANIFGGSSNIISSAGMRNFTRAQSNKYLKEHVLTDSKGNWNLKLKNGKPVTNKAELRKWIAEKGVLDTLIREEFETNPDLTGVKKKLGGKFGEFMRELGTISGGGKESDIGIRELFQKYDVVNEMTKKGAWFMNASERYLRSTAFISHAIQARNRFGKDARELPLDDPYIVQAGLDGIEATQFLYNAQSRPAFMRSSLGKIMSRFKLFAFKSVRLRKEFYKAAKEAGYKEGTEEFNKFKDLMMIDILTMALGSMFAYSLFDTSLPPPWDWLQESSEWLFGDKRERNRAFFGTYPYPLAPLQIVTPPVARIPMNIFSAFVNGDWDEFMDYHIHTMYPFGRIVRQVDKTFNEPYGTTFGRGMQQFFRLPTDKLVRKIDKARIREQEEERISRALGD